MKQNDFVYLSKIYNTLSLISTKGEDTLVMADCLRALKNFLNNQQIEQEGDEGDGEQ